MVWACGNQLFRSNRQCRACLWLAYRPICFSFLEYLSYSVRLLEFRILQGWVRRCSEANWSMTLMSPLTRAFSSNLRRSISFDSSISLHYFPQIYILRKHRDTFLRLSNCLLPAGAVGFGYNISNSGISESQHQNFLQTSCRLRIYQMRFWNR